MTTTPAKLADLYALSQILNVAIIELLIILHLFKLFSLIHCFVILNQWRQKYKVVLFLQKTQTYFPKKTLGTNYFIYL